jgi:hypothetical protein
MQTLWNLFLQVLHPFLGNCPLLFTISKQIAHYYTPANFLSILSFHKSIPLIIVLLRL